MLPLAGAQIPDSPDALTEALTRGLTARGLPPREVSAQGSWPALDLLRLDLTGVQIPQSALPGPSGAARNAGFTAARFELVADPARLESAPVQISLHAAEAAFDFAPGADGESMLVLRRATQGEAIVEIAVADLEALLLSVASEKAKQHGVEVKGVKLVFVSRGPRAVSVTAEVTAKMFIASAKVTLSGDLDLDEQLTARLSNLRFNGDGMVANLAGGFIRPHLATLEGRTFPLMSFALGEISLRDVQLQAGETLRLSARFGS